MVLKIAICGGGIGGLTTALCIDRLCGDRVELDVYEQASQYKEIGAGMSMGPNALNVLELVGLTTDLMKISSSSDSSARRKIWMRIRKWDSGDVVTEVKLPQGGHWSGFQRAEFLKVIYEAVSKNPKVHLHTNKRVTKVQTLSHGNMKVAFEDGTEAAADLVIGADGIHSVVRSKYLQDEAIFSGTVAYRGLIPTEKVREFWPIEDSDVAGFWSQQGKAFLTYPVSTDGRFLNTVGFAPEPSAEKRESWVQKAPKAEVLAVYKGWDPTVQKLIGLMPDEIGSWALYDRLPYNSWVFEEGKVVLIGDAAHPMLPYNGQGASQSIEDAYAIAKCLEAYCDDRCKTLESALRIYESIRLSRAAGNQASSRQAGYLYRQLGDMEDVADEEKRFEMMADKVQTRMHWIHGYNVDAEIKEKLETL